MDEMDFKWISKNKTEVNVLGKPYTPKFWLDFVGSRENGYSTAHPFPGPGLGEGSTLNWCVTVY